MILYLAIPIGILCAYLALGIAAKAKFHRDFNRNGG